MSTKKQPNTTKPKVGDTRQLAEEAVLIIRDQGFRPRMMDTVQRIADASRNRAWDEAAQLFGFRNAVHAAAEGFQMGLDFDGTVTLSAKEPKPLPPTSSN